jgi:hypothetical protein
MERLIAGETATFLTTPHGFVLIEDVKTRRDFLLAYGTNWFYQRVSFTEDIYRPEEDPGCVMKLFFTKHLAAFTRGVYLPDCPSMKNLIRINRYKLFFFPCHE